MSYVELQITSPYTFLEGASHAHELAAQAARLGHRAMAITDRNTLAGIVRAHVACIEQGIRLVVGAQLEFQNAPPLLFFPETREAYAQLSELLTLGRRRAPKGQCHLRLSDMPSAPIAAQIVVPVYMPTDSTAKTIQHLRQNFEGRLYLGMTFHFDGMDAERFHQIAQFAEGMGIPLVATNAVKYHVPDRKVLYDIVTCVRHHCTIDQAGLRVDRHAEYHLKSAADMAHLFRDYPEAIANTVKIADVCRFTLDELKYQYPDEVVSPGETAQQTLERLAWEGAAWRYPKGLPEKVRVQIERELVIVEQLRYAPYFLTVADIAREARRLKILHQGRGSAANSAVCYCLGVTAVDPDRIDVLFERFISDARDEPPDIDIDFEHERREEIYQYIYRKYGRNRAALTATVICYRTRAAINDVGKVLGLSEDTIRGLSKAVWGWSSKGVAEAEIRQAGLDPSDRRLAFTINLARELIGFPRHLSQHVGGFVITRDPLSTLVPIENAAMEDRTVIQWDKDDIDALGMLKVDILALGMLSCIRKAFDLLREKYDLDYDLATVPAEDKAVYQMVSRADTIGVFQIESRAQMSMLPRLRPQKFYDLVIEVAIVRPGPIQGDMVHPYLRRREGKEPVEYPSEELRRVLEKTMGVPLFQEQAMQIAIVAANFSPSDADRLRKAMATFKHTGNIGLFRDKFVNGMLAKGYKPDFAERCFAQIQGFGNYGFPESHAASFALLVYVSAWIKCHYPDVFAASLLNSQPMGFYAPAQIVRDAADHGIEIRSVDINHSRWDNTLEAKGNRHAVRLGFRQVRGFRQDHAEAIVNARTEPFSSLQQVSRKANLPAPVMKRLAEADAFGSLEVGRRQGLWQVAGLEDSPLPLFAGLEPAEEPVDLPIMPVTQEVIEDYRSLAMSLKAHPVQFLRQSFDKMGVVPTTALATLTPGTLVDVAGLVLVRQRPGSASGVIFMTLEDEVGIANIIVWPSTFEEFRATVMGGQLVVCRGRLQREGEAPHQVIHVVANRLDNMQPMLDSLREASNMPSDFESAMARADEVRHSQTRGKSGTVLGYSRDFH